MTNDREGSFPGLAKVNDEKSCSNSFQGEKESGKQFLFKKPQNILAYIRLCNIKS